MRICTHLQLERIAFIDKAVRSSQYPNASQLAVELEVAVRTIRRDITFIKDRWHAPLEYDARRNGYYYTDANFRLPCFAVTEGECLALFLAERLLQQYRNTPFADEIRGLFQRLAAQFTDTMTIDLSSLGDLISCRQQTTNPGEIERFLQLQRAVHRRNRLEIVYWSASRNDVSSRVVDPYHLATIDGDWYLLAHCHRRGAVLMFAPQRIREIRETGETFERPASFDADAYLQNSFRKVRGGGPVQTVRLRFTSVSPAYLREKQWHATQTWEDHADGSHTLSFRVNDLREVKAFVLSFGAECEVLEPLCLKADILKELEEMIGRMKGNAFRQS